MTWWPSVGLEYFSELHSTRTPTRWNWQCTDLLRLSLDFPSEYAGASSPSGSRTRTTRTSTSFGGWLCSRGVWSLSTELTWSTTTGREVWRPFCSLWWPACSGGGRAGGNIILCQTSSTRSARAGVDIFLTHPQYLSFSLRKYFPVINLLEKLKKAQLEETCPQLKSKNFISFLSLKYWPMQVLAATTLIPTQTETPWKY